MELFLLIMVVEIFLVFEMEGVGFEVILMRFFATVECLVIWMIILLDWVSKECVLRDFLNN